MLVRFFQHAILSLGIALFFPIRLIKRFILWARGVELDDRMKLLAHAIISKVALNAVEVAEEQGLIIFSPKTMLLHHRSRNFRMLIPWLVTQGRARLEREDKKLLEQYILLDGIDNATMVMSRAFADALEQHQVDCRRQHFARYAT